MQLPSRISVSERPYFDTVIAASAALLHALVLKRHFDPWVEINPDSRMVIYQTGAGVIAVVASLAAIGIATGGAGERRQSLRRLYGPELRRNWRSLLVLSIGASVCSLIAMIADGNAVSWAPFLFEFAVAWTVVRMLRLVWLIDALLAVEDADLSTPDKVHRLELNQDFVAKASRDAS